MSSGAKALTRYALQTDVATTPTTGWNTLGVTANTLDVKVDMTASDMITSDRMSEAGIPSSATVSGDLDTELRYGVLDTLLAAAFYNDWTSDVLSIGTVRKMFAIERAFADVNEYHLFKGCHVSALTIDVPSSGKITAKFSMVGLGYASNSSAAFAVSPAIADITKPIIASAGVGDITADGVTLTGVACASAFSLTIDNGLKEQKCLGKGLYAGAQIETQAAITGSLTLAYSPTSQALLSNRMTGAKIAIVVPIVDSLGNKYTITIPAAQINGELPSGGKSDLLEAKLTWTAVEVSPTITRDPV